MEAKIPTIARATGSATLTRTWAITACPNAARCTQVTTTVSWTDIEWQAQSTQLTTFIAQVDPVSIGLVLAASSVGGGSITVSDPTTETDPTTDSTPDPTFGSGNTAPITDWTGYSDPQTITWPEAIGATEYLVYSCSGSNGNSLSSCTPSLSGDPAIISTESFHLAIQATEAQNAIKYWQQTGTIRVILTKALYCAYTEKAAIILIHNNLMLMRLATHLRRDRFLP